MYESDIKITNSGAVNIVSRSEAKLAANFLSNKFPNLTVTVDDRRRNFFVVIDGEDLSLAWLKERGIDFNGFCVALGWPTI